MITLHDSFLPMALLFNLGCWLYFFWRWAKLSAREQEVDALGRKFEQVNLNTPSHGIVTICSYCKKVKTADGHWHAMDHFLEVLQKTRLSHGLCDQCAQHNWPDIFGNDMKNIKTC